jgi:hypothetical protein
MTQNIPFLTVVNAILNENQPFPAKLLHRFSDLEPVDLKKLKSAWPQVSQHRKHTLLEDLEDLADADHLNSFSELARSLLGDPDPQVRTRAIRLLGESDDVELVPVFLDLLCKEEDVEVRAASANALGQFVSLGELDKIPSERYQKIINQLLNSTKLPNPILVRRHALESLGFSGHPDVVSLIEKAFNEKDPDWRVSALIAMGRSCDDRWRKPVLSQLRSPDEDIRTEAIHAAGELELEGARIVLLDLLEDEDDQEVRHELIWALSRIGGEGVRSKLEQLQEIEEDDLEADFIEEALDTLSFKEDMGNFSLFDVDPEVDFVEEEPNEKEDDR